MRAWVLIGIKGPERIEPLKAGVEWRSGEHLELWHAPSDRESPCQWVEYHDDYFALAPFRS